MSASCRVDQKLTDTLCPNDDRPCCIGPLADDAQLVAEQTDNRLDHLLWQKSSNGRVTDRFKTYLEIEDRPETLEHAMWELEGILSEIRLLYVLKRRKLSPASHHAYVFRGRLRNRPCILALPAVSRVVEAGLRASKLESLHTPWSRVPWLDTPDEVRCSECKGVHLRLVITFFTVKGKDNPKLKYLDGKESDGVFFDPFEDCEWFDTLPSNWRATIGNGLVTLHRPFGEPLIWNDPVLAKQRMDKTVLEAGDEISQRLAYGYRLYREQERATS